MDKKISQLTAASTPLLGTELLPLVQSSVTKKASVQDVLGYLVNDSTNSILKTVYNSNNIGMLFDFTGSYKFGDFDLLNSGTYIDISDGFSVISLQAGTNNNGGTQLGLNDTFGLIATSYQNADIGLKLDFANGANILGTSTSPGDGFAKGFIAQVDYNTTYPVVKMGDSDGGNPGNLTCFEVNDNSQTIKSINQGNDIGLKLDFANGQYKFGDFNTNPSGNYIYIDSNLICSNNFFNGSEGIVLDMANRNFMLGDPGNVNGTRLVIDDANQRLELSGNLSANTAGASASKFLKVRIGGVDYKIALLNN